MARCELGSGRSRYLSQGDIVIDAPLLVPCVPLLVDELDAQAANGQLPPTAGPLGEARTHVREATARERRCFGDRRSRPRDHPALRWDL
jgi:hypothetical protein